MDAERFGRALGMGVREAAKALLRAADAAAAPNPRATRQAGQAAHQGVLQGKAMASGVRRGGKRFGEAVWTPAARAGSVLWFEVTGVFFGLFALAACVEVWRRRADFAAGTGGRVWFAVVMAVVFGGFTAQSFLKARRRARR